MFHIRDSHDRPCLGEQLMCFAATASPYLTSLGLIKLLGWFIFHIHLSHHYQQVMLSCPVTSKEYN